MTALRRLTLVPTEAMTMTEPAVRIAIATNDGKRLDAHFGSASRFVVYDVTKAGHQFIETLQFDDVSDESGKHKTEGDDRITPKVEGLKGTHLLFCLAIGGPSAAKIVTAGIHPVKMPNPMSVDEVLEKTRVMLNSAPPPWLRKVLAQAGIGEKKPAFADED
jgi:nitrogen fixation protein NifX